MHTTKELINNECKSKLAKLLSLRLDVKVDAIYRFEIKLITMLGLVRATKHTVIGLSFAEDNVASKNIGN